MRVMSNIKAIRDRLQMTQSQLAAELGCTQGLVWQMENGSTVMPDTAKDLIALAAKHGQVITFNDIYGLPAVKAKRAHSAKAA